VLSNAIVAGTVTVAGEKAFLDWAWRIPFFLSIVLVGIGLYIRLGIRETPVFQALVQENRVERRPVTEVVRRNWREIVLSALLRVPEQAPFYLFTVFVFTYGAAHAFNKPFLTWAVSVAGLVSFITIPLFGYLSDVIGRKTMYMLGIAVMAAWGFVYFGLFIEGAAVLVFVVIALSLIPHDMQYGPQASLIAESFTGRLRYSGASLGYQLASIIAGGPAPYIATGLWAGKFDILGASFASPFPAKNPYIISLYILVCCVIGFLGVVALRDRSALDHTIEYEEQERIEAEGVRRPARA
jgi:MFS family permease